MKPSTGLFSSGRTAWIIFGMNAVIAMIGLVARIIISTELLSSVTGFWPSWPFFSALYGFFGAMILSRYPRHVVGRLFMIVSFVAALVTCNPLLVALQARDLPELLNILFSLLGELLWILSLLIPMTLMLQFFPDGRLPSRRWWPLPLATVLGMAGMTLGYTPEVFGLAEDDALIELLGYVVTPFFTLAVLGSLGAVVVRFLRSRAAERAQMKWLVFTASTGILFGFLMILVLDEDNLIVGVYFTLLPSLLALAIGIAILRYRLFDIDIIIRRTLQYGLLTGLLALVYFGLVVMLQTLFSAMGDFQSEIFIVISTLAIAGLFNPLRRRVQEAVDRRFYRGKYDAERALSRFAAVARDEVDLELLTAALLQVVDETMQPDGVSLSLTTDEIADLNPAALQQRRGY